jgi:cytochrome P450
MDRPKFAEAAHLRAKPLPFDVERLRLRGPRRLLALLFANPPPWAYALLRRWLPVLRLFGWRYPRRKALDWLPLPAWRRWALVTRREEVLEVLANDALFNVWWGDDLRLLNDGDPKGTPFILGLDGIPSERDEYARQLRHVMWAFSRTDVERLVAPQSARAAQSALEAVRPGVPFDAIGQLMLPVFFDTCERYFGVRVEANRRTDFFYWSVAASGLLFGPPFERDRLIETAQDGACRMAEVIDIAIESAIADAAGSAKTETVLARLARRHRAHDLGRLEMRAMLMGMIVGSVPTNTVAAGHILDTLLSSPDRLDVCREAASRGDDAWLSRCLFEAMRFWPLNPGPWRRCAEDAVIARGTPHETRLRKGTIVLASTQSAMLDPSGVREPLRYDPSRDPADALMFGSGRHWCVGRYIADAQIVQAFKPLLLARRLQRAPGRGGRMSMIGLFPEHLEVVIDR